jgi:hypothetical protein
VGVSVLFLRFFAGNVPKLLSPQAGSNEKGG